MTTKKLWIIEDLEDLQPVYRSIFEKSETSFDLRFFLSFDQFSKAYHTEKDRPDLIIADIMLEDGHFVQLLNDADISLSTPFLVVTVCDDYETINSAFKVGAIDYILKPFNQNEIRAKVEKHLVSIEEKINESFKTLEALNLNLTDFTNMEVKIIESFHSKDDLTLHRNDLVKIIWRNIAIHPNTLDVHIYNLRKKLRPYNYLIKAIGNGLFRFINNNESSLATEASPGH